MGIKGNMNTNSNAGVVRVQVRFVGRVQGVGFRATARSIAMDHPVRGFVRNEADGSVLLEAQGLNADVRSFLAELRSAFARNIEQLHESSMDADASEPAGFVIRR
jgi:acylphosphatase